MGKSRNDILRFHVVSSVNVGTEEDEDAIVPAASSCDDDEDDTGITAADLCVFPNEEKQETPLSLVVAENKTTASTRGRR